MSEWKNKNIKGFTLVEIVVTFALVSIMLILGITLNGYMNKSVSIGNRQVNLQSYCRLYKELIDNEVKLTNSISISSGIPANEEIPATQKAIYVNGAGKVVTKSNDGTETILFSNIPDNITMSLSFQKINDTDVTLGNKLLGYTIICSCAGDTYQLDSSILILSSADLSTGDESGVAIIYKP